MMKKKHFKQFILSRTGIICLCMVAVLCSLLLALSFLSTIKVLAKRATSEVFVTRNVQVDEANEESGSKGLKMLGLVDGASARIVDDITGCFSVELGFGTSTLKEITLVITSVDKKDTFSVVVENIPQGYNVAVEAFGNKAGIYYALGTTTLTSAEMNAQGVYTQVYGQTLTLTFNPNTMQVFANDTLVWDFTVAANGWANIGGTIDFIPSYTAEFLFENADRENGFYLYKLQGERLNSPILVNTCGPELFADVAKNGVAKKEYLIPAGYAYDLIDGAISQVYVSVEKVETYSEVTVLSKRIIKNDMPVVLSEEGKYKITYYASDSHGIENKKHYYIDVISEKGEVVFVMDQATFPQKIGVGSSIILPKVSVCDSLYRNETRMGNTLLTVKKDGLNLGGYQQISVAENQVFTFGSVGNYQLLYTPDGGSAEESYGITFTVVNNLPVINFPFVSSEFICGETFTPTALNAVYGGLVQNLAYELSYPQGGTRKSSTFALSEYGLYTLSYKAVFGKDAYTFQRTFETLDKVVSVQSEQEKEIAYIATEYSDIRGIGFTLKENEILKYNKIVDLNKQTASNKIIELFVTPRIAGDLEADMIDIVLTDIYDKNNYVTIRSYSDKQMSYNYLTAGVKNNRKVGWNNGVLKTWASGGTNGYAMHSGKSKDGAYNPINFSFDYSTGKVYVINPSGEQILVTDLTNPSEHEEVFKGFTTGEVFVTVKLHSVLSADASFLLRSIGGQIFTDIYATNSPDVQIEVDTLGYDESELPDAQKGKPYELFNATCTELNGKSLMVTEKVYFKYGTLEQRDVQIINGAFTPQYVGEYTIVYSAITNSGKKVEKTLLIQAKQSAVPVYVEIEPTLGTKKVGVKVLLNQAVVSGGTGKTYTVITYVAPSGENRTAEENSFVPYETGKYVITYTVYDYIGKAYEESFEILVEANSKPVFEENFELPKFFINGKKYVLPKISATDYSKTVKTAPIRLFVVENGVSKELTNFTYTPNLTGGGNVTLKYVAEGEIDNSELSFDIPVKDLCHINEFYEPEYNMTEFFIGKNIEVTSDESNLYVTSTAKGAYFEYIYPLLAEGFDFKFNFLQNHSTASGISVWMIDAEDESVAIKLTFMRNGNSNETSLVSLNGGESGFATGSLNGRGANFNLKYDNQRRSLTDNLNYSYIVNYTVDGKTFDGFPSGKLLLRVEFIEEETNVNTTLICTNINYQSFSSEKLDEVAPQIAIESTNTRYVTLGEIAKVPSAIALDVLDDDLIFTISGECNGKYLTATDGTLLKDVKVQDYQVLFNEVGVYTFMYTATDKMGNRTRGYTTLSVVDNVAPTITVSAKQLTGKVDSPVKLSPASAVDNGESLEVYAVVVRPDLVIDNVSGWQYTPKMKGTYTICYICIDKSGNLAKVSVILEVK